MSRANPLSSQSPEYKGIDGLNIIYECGLDSESRPILALCADHLPNPDLYDYDLILSFIMARLDEFVENDYVLVFFSAPAKYRPGWFWLLKAYRSLDRKYKKNLKALYVVHLTRMYRLVFDLSNRIISPKFAQKLHYISSLNELKASMPLAPQFITKRVVEYDSKLPDQHVTQTRSIKPPGLVFGKRLEELEQDDKTCIPKIALQLVEHIQNNGIDKEGIFRKSPSGEELRLVKGIIDQGNEVDLNQYDIDVSASLLKVFVRELAEPLIDLKVCEEMGALPDASICTQDTLRKVRSKLTSHYAEDSSHFKMLRYLCGFLYQVSEHNSNRMNVHNLSVVFTPNIVRPAVDPSKKGYMSVPDSQQSALEDAAVYLQQMGKGMVLVQLLIAKHQDIFE